MLRLIFLLGLFLQSTQAQAERISGFSDNDEWVEVPLALTCHHTIDRLRLEVWEPAGEYEGYARHLVYFDGQYEIVSVKYDGDYAPVIEAPDNRLAIEVWAASQTGPLSVMGLVGQYLSNEGYFNWPENCTTS